ncbi:MAG: beta-propeller domain-containing protein [bacterium]
MNTKPKHIWLAIALALPLAGCGAAGNAPSPTKALGGFRFAKSCEEIKSYARSFQEKVKQNPDRAVPIAAPAAPAAPSQGAGAPETAADTASAGGAVQQSDLAFPDLERGLLYTLASGQKELKIFRVSPSSQTKLAASLALDFFPAEVVATQAGNRAFAVVFGSNGGGYGVGPEPLPAQTLALSRGKAAAVESPPQTAPGGSGDSPVWGPPEEPMAVMALIEVSNPEQPKILREEQSPGYFLEARALSGQGKVVWITEHYVPVYIDPLSDNQILPNKSVRAGGGTNQVPLADCTQTYLYENPTLDPAYSPASLNEAVVSLLDLKQPEAEVVTQAIYSPAWRTLVAANPEHLFLAQNVDSDGTNDTELYQFQLDGNSLLALSASVALPGTVPNQFFLDEKDGTLRVFHHVQNFSPVCLDNCVAEGGGGGSIPVAAMKDQQSAAVGNYLSTYRQKGDQFELLGRSGPFEAEEVPYAARFVGTLGCVITFRQIDPLTCFTLKDPSQPTKLGELKIEGVSFHLEAVGEGLLLGIGQGSESGSVVANLFDISNPAQPSLAAQKKLNSGSYGYSPVFYDYRALGKDEALRNFAVPIEDEGGSTLALFSVDPLARKITSTASLHKSFSPEGPYDSFLRAFFFNDTLATVSSQQLDVFLRSNWSQLFSATLTN